jgi:hypothetical protein
VPRRQRWDEGHDCEHCDDEGSFSIEIAGEEYTGFCLCSAGDEAHELHELQVDGWAA